MDLFNDEHSVRLGEHTVGVTGRTGPVRATWTLLVDGEAVDTAAVVGGDVELRAELPAGGGTVTAQVRQSVVGPTEVVVAHDDREVTRFKGFVA